MRASEKVLALTQHALAFGRRWSPRKALSSQVGEGVDYPRDIADLIVFHKLHSSLPAEMALKGYLALKDVFVDWNEVRISSVREIQEALKFCPGSLELAVFLKDTFELLHRERQDVSLEFLSEQNLGEIRQFLKRLRGLDASTIEVLLKVRKDYPVFPISPAIEAVLVRLGIARKADGRAKSERLLHEAVDPARALLLHHFLLDHSLTTCPPNEELVDCPHCGIRQMCAFFQRNGRRHPRRSTTERARAARRQSRPSRTSARKAAKSGARAARARRA